MRASCVTNCRREDSSAMDNPAVGISASAMLMAPSLRWVAGFTDDLSKPLEWTSRWE